MESKKPVYPQIDNAVKPTLKKVEWTKPEYKNGPWEIKQYKSDFGVGFSLLYEGKSIEQYMVGRYYHGFTPGTFKPKGGGPPRVTKGSLGIPLCMIPPSDVREDQKERFVQIDSLLYRNCGIIKEVLSSFIRYTLSPDAPENFRIEPLYRKAEEKKQIIMNSPEYDNAKKKKKLAKLDVIDQWIYPVRFKTVTNKTTKKVETLVTLHGKIRTSKISDDDVSKEKLTSVAVSFNGKTLPIDNTSRGEFLKALEERGPPYQVLSKVKLNAFVNSNNTMFITADYILFYANSVIQKSITDEDVKTLKDESTSIAESMGMAIEWKEDKDEDKDEERDKDKDKDPSDDLNDGRGDFGGVNPDLFEAET